MADTRTERHSPIWPTRVDVGLWLTGIGVLIVVALVMALSLAQAVDAPASELLPDVGPVTRWGLPILRTVGDALAVAVVGLLLTATVLLPSPQAELAGLALRAYRAACWPAVAWAVAALGQVVLTASATLGVPAGDVIGTSSLLSFTWQLDQGRALLWQACLALVVAVVVRWTWRSREAIWTLLLALVTVAPPLLTGHAASAGSHDAAIVSLLVHVVAATVWVGGLAGLAWVASRGSRRLAPAVTRYSTLAGWCLAAVALSGVANAAVRLSLGDLLTTSYGGLVLAKAVAVVLLGGIGLLHRRRTVARLEAATDAALGHDVGVRRPFVTLAVVELAVMGAAVAIAVALSQTSPPIGRGSVDPVEAIIGHPLPPAPSLEEFMVGIVPGGLGIALVVILLALYVQGLLVLRRRGDAWPVGRTLAWLGGLLVIAWSTFGGLGMYSHVLFSAHMVAHMLLSMVAPILLVLGAPVTLALRTLPSARVAGELGPRQVLLGILHSRPVSVLTHPVVAGVLFVGSLYAIYFSSLFSALMNSHLGHAAMTLHFVAVGSLFFYVLVGIDPSPRSVAPLWRFGLLLVVMPFHAFFAIALMSYDRVLGESYWQSLDRPYRTDLLADQVTGGSLSWALGEIPIVIVLVAIFVQWVRSDTREAKRTDRRSDRLTEAGQDDEHDQYNAYLAALGKDQRR